MAEGVRKVAEAGEVYDAAFHVEQELVVVLHARGGAFGSGQERNTQYTDGLRAALRKLADASATIEEMRLDSSNARDFSLQERILRLKGYDFPLDLHPGEDVDELVKQASKAMQTQCRDPHAKSRHGNPTRRLKIFVRGPWETAQELEDYLAAP